MTQHQWVAIDSRADRRSWARELALAHERAIRGGEPQPNVRDVITASWDRCERSGFNPDGDLAPVELSVEEAGERWRESPLSAAEPILKELLADVGSEGRQVVLACDRDGTMLWVDGEPSLLASAQEVHVQPGARWDEPSAGTNAMGTALAAGHPLQVFSAEHFAVPVHEWTCSAAPVTDPETGEQLGVLDLSGELSTAHPYSLALVSGAARMVEAELARRAAEEATGLRERFVGVIGRGNGRPVALSSAAGTIIESRLPELTGERLLIPKEGGEVGGELGLQLYAEPVDLGGFLIWRALTEPDAIELDSCTIRALGTDRASIHVGNGSLELSPRHSEILLLLTLRPEGMTAEQLALELYGDFGKPVTARVEVARARRKLGDLIAADPYRLIRPVLGDFIEVEELAASGRVREGLERYQGPLLPQSEVPLVIEARQHLDNLVRTAVLHSDDADLLDRWLEKPSGRDDVEACRRLAHLLPPDDLRRPKALSRLRRLCGSAG